MQGSTRAADIRKALQRDKGVSIAFTSIRHALDRLAQRAEVEASRIIRHGVTWGRQVTNRCRNLEAELGYDGAVTGTTPRPRPTFQTIGITAGAIARPRPG